MFKENLSIAIQKRDVTLYRITKDTGIPKSILYDWASGAREPVSEYIVKLADYLDVSIDYLLGRTDKPEVNR